MYLSIASGTKSALSWLLGEVQAIDWQSNKSTKEGRKSCGKETNLAEAEELQEKLMRAEEEEAIV